MCSLRPPPCLSFFLLFWETCLSQLHSPHSARPGQEHSWPDLVEPVDRRMERSPPRARFLRKHAQVWGLQAGLLISSKQHSVCVQGGSVGRGIKKAKREVGGGLYERGVSRPKLCQHSPLMCIMCASIMGICVSGSQGHPRGRQCATTITATLELNCVGMVGPCPQQPCQQRGTWQRMGL